MCENDMENSYEELQLIKNIQQGNHQAFEQLFKSYFQYLVHFAWRYVESNAIAEDLVQEVFSKIWENQETWIITGSLRSYLRKSVANQALNYLKHKKLEEKYDKEWMKEKALPPLEFEEHMRNKQIVAAISQAVEELPRRSKMTFELRYNNGLTYFEIAKVMGVSIKTVESQMTIILKKLRHRLSKYQPIYHDNVKI